MFGVECQRTQVTLFGQIQLAGANMDYASTDRFRRFAERYPVSSNVNAQASSAVANASVDMTGTENRGFVAMPSQRFIGLLIPPGCADQRSRDDVYALLYICPISQGDKAMDAITYSAARANLAKTMDRVCDDHEPLIITRNGEQSVVMLSLEDFQALEETSYLLRSPANAKRLLAAAAQLAAGEGTERQLCK